MEKRLLAVALAGAIAGTASAVEQADLDAKLQALAQARHARDWCQTFCDEEAKKRTQENFVQLEREVAEIRAELKRQRKAEKEG